MYTSVILVAISGLLVPSTLGVPAWQTSYDGARKLGLEAGKPLAVFIGSGKAGWNRLVTEGQLSNETSRILSADYVCVYLDVAGPAGKRLADAFGVFDGQGLIISDIDCKLQAFRHEGELADDDLAQQLRKYADPERVVRATESTQLEWTSYYSAEQIQPAPLTWITTWLPCSAA